MRILYISQFDALRPRTNQLSDLRMCDGLLENKVDLTLITPKVNSEFNLPLPEILKNAGVNEKMKVDLLACFANNELKKVNFILFLLSLALRLTWKCLFAKEDFYVISRSFGVVYLANTLKKLFWLNKMKTVIWSHDFKANKIYSAVFEQSDFVFATNSAILESVKNLTGRNFTTNQITLNPITKAQLANWPSKAHARQKLGLDSDQLYVVYTGKFYIGQQEVGYFLEAANAFPNAKFIITGGRPKVIKHYQSEYEHLSNLILTGFLDDYQELAYYQSAADILVSYYTIQDHQVDYNLPQKIIEYMVSGGAIITPEFKSTQDILNEANAYFVKPESQVDLNKGLEKLLEDKELRESLGSEAQKDAKDYTFNVSAGKILRTMRS